ncbi:MAG: hypothetical protein JW789_04335 [Candidatus Aenigmarchaeota archaeon]|nr:hypothetical protein [Candidatus Aenigmarchaeota archaeon]
MGSKKAALMGRVNRYLLTPKLRVFMFRIAVRMLSSGITIFMILFTTVASMGLIIQLMPWIFLTGVTDIDPLMIIAASTVAGFTGVYIRYLILSKFSHITVYPKKEYSEEFLEEKRRSEGKKDEPQKSEKKEENNEDSSSENLEKSN